MNICFFGIYDPDYSRNRVLVEGFRRLGHTVVPCRVDPRKERGIKKYFALYREYRQIRQQSFDYVIVCFPGHTVVWLARILFGKRIVFDAFLSLYDSNVFDRKMYSSRSLRAWRDWFYDKTSTMFAWKVLLDTNMHIQYFHETFGTPISKCIRVWVSADDSVFFPQPFQEEEKFTVHFHGTFIPLQGILYIIEAATILKEHNINFRIIGSGQEFSYIKEIVATRELQNVTFVGSVPKASLPEYIATAHVTLGIFGNTEKAQCVIPNKVYESIAMGKATITADTPALRELLPEADVVLTVPVANGHAIADAILQLQKDSKKRLYLGAKAREFFEQNLLPEKLLADLITSLSVL